jgi:hypothetical protein
MIKKNRLDYVKMLWLTIYLLLFSMTTVKALPNFCYADGASPSIDGKLDANEWQNAIEISDFWQHFPNDTAKASNQTRVFFSFDTQNLYIAAICKVNKFPLYQTLKRDHTTNLWQADAFSIVIDPLNNKSNGYYFLVNAGGAQMDGLVSGNGELDVNWDTKWVSATSFTEGEWYVEIAIPFKSLKFSEKNLNWGFNFIRTDMGSNMTSSWKHIPVNYAVYDLGFTDSLPFNTLPSSKSGKTLLVPYISTGMNRAGTINKLTKGIGSDVKLSLGGTLNLDMTINPDFSQVEVDRQIINLSRFSVTFPEKRNFFLENSDLFSFGTSSAQPLLTRNIGLSKGQTVPIYFGARLTGNISNSTRIGLMSIQTEKKENIAGQNFTVSVLQQKIKGRSNINFFLINRQAFEKAEILKNDYNRVWGAKLNLISQNSRWNSYLIYHASSTPHKYRKNQFIAGNIVYNSRKFTVNLAYSKLEKNYIADIGYTPRLYNYDALRDTMMRIGYTEIKSSFSHRTYPKIGIINQLSPSFLVNAYLNPDGSLNEVAYQASYFINFVDKSDLTFTGQLNVLNLPFEIDLYQTGQNIAAKRYNNLKYSVVANTDPRRAFNLKLGADYGGFYNGTKFTVNAVLSGKKQPWGNVSLSWDYNDVWFSGIYPSAKYHFIGPKTEIAFSNNLFLTNFFQYNTQLNNFNINSRFQWRFRPMSDVFIVFTNNYLTPTWKQNNLGIMFKMTWWINV